MALILKSDATYTGTLTLPGVADIAQSAQEYYNDYAAWVTGDGGVIHDSTATLNAITWAKSQGILGRTQAVSASWGVKKSGSNVISRVYGLGGDIFEYVGSPGTHDTGGAFPLIALNGGYLKQVTPRRNIRSMRVVMGAVAAKLSSSQYIAFSITNGSSAIASDLAIIIHKNGEGAPKFASITPYVQVDIAAVTDYQAVTGYIDSTSISVWNNGVFGITVNNTNLATYKAAASSEIWLGKLEDTSAPYGISTNSFLAEFWLINDGSSTLAQALGARLDTLY